ncbi:MAG: hypothetical protein E7517_03295 [Ruminococcaceae bacterium]|nr:hypothetical protein [Oscillospiraceae bacterium]
MTNKEFGELFARQILICRKETMKKEIDKNKLIAVYKSQIPVAEICRIFGISKQTLYNILKSERVDLNRQKLHDNCGCPLFKKDMYNSIYCEDFGDWECLSLAFCDKQAKNAHKKKYCAANGYVNCSVYQMMERL